MLGGSGLGSQTLHASQAGSIPRSWFQTGGKATNFVSYSGACARPVGGSSQACPALSTSVCQKTAKIAGYNQGKRGGGLGPLLQLQWKCYKVSQETEDHLTQLSWNQNTFFSEGNLLSFLLPLPVPPLPWCTPYFLGGDFISSMQEKGDYLLCINLALALSLLGILLGSESWKLNFKSLISLVFSSNCFLLCFLIIFPRLSSNPSSWPTFQTGTRARAAHTTLHVLSPCHLNLYIHCWLH